MKNKKKISTRNIWLIGIACTLLFIIGTVVIYDNFRYTLDYLRNGEFSNKNDSEEKNNTNLDKDDISSDTDEEKIEDNRLYSRFVDLSDVEITYATELEDYNCKIDSNGFLQGDCAIPEIKNKRFINLIEGNDDFFDDVYVLGVDGIIYNIAYNEEKIMYLNGTDNSLENVTRMGYIKVYTTECRWWNFPIYTINNKEYILDLSSDDWEKAENILLSEAKTNSVPIASVWSCGYEGNEIFIDTTISINKNIILSDGSVVKDRETKTAIEVKYSIYQYINGKESLHIISTDNKYYILEEEAEYITKEDSINNIYLKDNYLTLYLLDGRMVVLILSN